MSFNLYLFSYFFETFGNKIKKQLTGGNFYENCIYFGFTQ